MTLTQPRTDQDMVGLNPHTLVVVTHHGVMLPGSQRQDLLPAGLAELSTLAALSVGGTRERIVSEAAAASASDEDFVRHFVDQMIDRKHASTAPSRVDLASPDALVAAPTTDDFDVVTLPVPTVFEILDGEFVTRTHEGEVRSRMSAIELVALTSLIRPGGAAEAAERQREQLGTLALGDDAWNSLLRRLLAAEVIVEITADGPDARKHDRLVQMVRRERLGRRLVSESMARRRKQADREEKARRAKTGVARAKVFPVHAMSTSWRNPPLSLGLILAYAMEADEGRLTESFDIRAEWMITEETVATFVEEPAIFLFSSYIWSSAQNLAISAAVKEASPGSVTIHGGPNVPKYQVDVDRFFADHPHVDVVVHGEGEVTTAELLAALAGQVSDQPLDLNLLRGVAGLSFRDGDGSVRTADRDRITDLDALPSPMLNGLFDGYTEAWKAMAAKGHIDVDGWRFETPVVCLETNRGCPYGCTFCDWGSATNSRIRKYSIERIFAELEWCADQHVDSVGLADANFGIFARDVDITAKVAELKKTHGWPRQFGTNYAKNTVKHLQHIVEMLSEAEILSYGLLSLQAMDEDTLLTIRRSNIKLEKYESLAAEFRKADLPLYVDLMVGLPGQTVRSFADDLQECINREVHTKIFPTQLLVNSPMNEPEYREVNGIVAMPGELVMESNTFTNDEYNEMLDLRLTFFLLEKFGAARQFARFVRQATGMLEMDFYRQLATAAREEPDRWPVLAFVVSATPYYMVPPVSWRLLADELRTFAVEVTGVPDDSALDTAIAVQHALLPDRTRTFPCEIQLEHDFTAWHTAMLDAKEAGSLGRWHKEIPPLSSYGPATFTVDDPRKVSTHELGNTADTSPWDAWDLASPVSRSVMIGQS